MDWTPLADDDPLPGDAAGVTSAARRFDELGEALRDQAGRVVEVDPERVWAGLAAVRFAEARDRLPAQLRAVARRCELASDALGAWAGDVEDTQQAGLVARDRAREAEEDIEEALAGLAAIEAHEAQAQVEAEAWNRAHPEGPHRSPEPWAGPDWNGRLQDARWRLQQARRCFARTVMDHRDAAARTVDRLAAADEVLDDPAWAIGPLGRMVSRAVQAPGTFEFAVTERGLVLNTPEAWRWEAYRQAGIDPARWDPSRGLAELDGIAVDAWSFYADLHQRRPDQFLWAGMANLAGGTFYAAFQDIHVLRRGLEDGSVTADEVGDVLERMYPGLPGEVVDQLGDLAAEDLDAFADEVRYVETEFLSMQKQIFDDLGWQHVAFEEGGLEAVEELYDRGQLEDVHIEAWREIDTGDSDRVAYGNRVLLEHEQRSIIGDDYDEVRNRSTVTWAMTIGMSVVAHSPVPGGRPFREVVPYEVTVDTPDRIPVVPDPVVPDRIPFTDIDVPGGGGVHVDSPDELRLGDLPINNVSIYQHRWEWIEQDMLPAWIQHVDDGTAMDLVAEPIPEQAARQRLIPDWLLTYEPE